MSPAPNAIVNRQVVENQWQHIDDDSALPDSGDITVSLKRWQEAEGQFPDHVGQVAVRLSNDIDVEEVYPGIAHSPMILLDFPIIDTNKRGYHPDGKAYSQARLLRERCGYRGEIRAHGQEVISDVLLYMERCGINAFEMREGQNLGKAIACFSEFSEAYQGAASGPQPIFLRRRAAT